MVPDFSQAIIESRFGRVRRDLHERRLWLREGRAATKNCSSGIASRVQLAESHVAEERYIV